MARRRARWGALVAPALLASVAAACGSDGGDNQSFCAALRSAPTLESVVSGFTGLDDAELTRRLDQAESAYGRVERAAPDAVGDDVETVVSVVDAVIASVRINRDDPAAAVTAVRFAIEDHPDLQGASTRVAAYAKDECELDLNPGITPDTTTTTATDG